MILKKYSELKQYVDAFNDDHIHLLIVKSDGGLGKTNMTSRTVKDAILFRGHATPLSIYLKLQKNPNKKVIFDDVDTLINNKTNLALLKQICETTDKKTVCYSSTAKIVEEDSFISQNKVILLCNDIKRIGKNMNALLTRGFLIDFIPENSEVISLLEEFAEDKEILDFIKAIEKSLSNLNFRTYLKALELKKAGIDWRIWIETEFSQNHMIELAKEIRHLPKEKRNTIWQNETGKSVRTLQRVIKTVKNDTLNRK